MPIINRVGSLGGGDGFDLAVSNGADDGYWYASSYRNDLTYMYVGYNVSVNMHGFARWTGINIPSDAVISKAEIIFYITSVNGSPTANVYFNDVKNTAAPTSASDAESKVKTTALSYTGVLSTGWNTINVSAIIAELRASYGAYSNNSMMALLRGAGTGTNYGYVSTSEAAGYAPILRIRW